MLNVGMGINLIPAYRGLELWTCCKKISVFFLESLNAHQGREMLAHIVGDEVISQRQVGFNAV